MSFSFHTTSLRGVILIEPKVHGDERGFFLESFKQSDFAAAGLDLRFVQENHSRSEYGVLRGLHYQRAPRAQGKLLRVVVGSIFDVAVDLRDGSPTFGKWLGIELSAANHRSIYIPPGFAHGFCVVSPEAEVIYNTTVEYAPNYEHGLRWDDPSLNISWPVTDPVLSERDRHWPHLVTVQAIPA
ncbi:MAG TPA: dTDP-4-dehydrorhamnose 3,5-epimerase [Vicinamibacterales bacterium]|nr:dTDP-4-dehydrorhamnose 3,5-epimerase [Vicinamibacterales bacterium]